ncbi:MAG TPA: alpha/beta hydrolase [Acidimicrobiales bacterium]|nr:alpha/beta hydrolase [Acidimicrobiales bacterium]
MTVLDEARLPTSVGEIEIRRGGTPGECPLVYLHSAQGEGAGMVLLEELADGREVVAPVFPGFGASQGLEAIDDIEDASFHLLDVLDRLEFPQVDLLGLSLGGWMAAELATRWPDRVRRVVLVNAVGLYVEGAPITEIFGRPLDELADELFADPEHPVAQLMRAMAQAEQNPGEIPFDMIRPMIQAQAATAKLGWNPYLHNPKLGGRLRRISAPALVLRGRHDGIVPRAHAEAYAAGIPDARLVDLDDAAHMATLEVPAEVARLVHSHLQG